MVDLADSQRVDLIGLIILLVAIGMILQGHRLMACVGLAFILTFVPASQKFVFGGLDLSFLRIGILVGFVRWVVGDRGSGLSRLPTDKLVLAWIFISAVVQLLQSGSIGSFLARIAFGIDSAGAYFLGRVLVRSSEDFGRLCRVVALIAIASAVPFLVEWLTGRNLFAALGGVPYFTEIREGRLRCQGPFSHPIMAGVFWAMWLPPFLAYGLIDRSRLFFWLLASGCSLLIVAATASSTPLMAVILGLGVLVFYQGRAYWRSFAIAALGALVAMHFVMENGAHSILARINIVSGSTGWHRYQLMDQAAVRFSEWWLLGTPSTTHWGAGLRDVTNQYLLEGVRGGIASLVLFVGIVCSSCSKVLRASAVEPGLSRSIVLWAIAASMIACAVNFIGVSVFDAATAGWFFFVGAGVSVARYSRLFERGIDAGLGKEIASGQSMRIAARASA